MEETVKYPIGNCRAHTRNQGYRSTITESDALFCERLGGHEDTGDIDLKHQIRILGRVIQSRRLLLNARGCDQPVHPAMFVSNPSYYSVQLVHISHIDLLVVECRPELLFDRAWSASVKVAFPFSRSQIWTLVSSLQQLAFGPCRNPCSAPVAGPEHIP